MSVLVKVLRQIFMVLLDFNVTGNPVLLIQDLSTGLVELVYEPSQGAVHGPNAFISGVRQGTQSFAGHTVGTEFVSV